MTSCARILLAFGLTACSLSLSLAEAQTIVPIGNGFSAPQRIATDAASNVFIADQGNNIVREVLADGNYGTTRTFGNGIALPQGVAIDGQGNIFILDTVNQTVAEILAAGGTVSIHPGQTAFSGATGIALDSSGNLFVLEEGGLLEFPAAGGYTNVNGIYFGDIGVEQGGIALDSTGNLYVAGTSNPNVSNSGQIIEFLVAGGYQTTETLGYGFGQINGIAVDRSGNVYVADTTDNTVREIPAAGGLVPTIKTLGSGFQNPTGVSVDADGNVFVADTGNNAVKEILAAGGYATVQTLAGGFNQPSGLTFGPGGNLFVADTADSAIKELAAAGNYATSPIVSYGFNHPAGVAVDGQGNLFVADSGNNAVKEIPAAGGYADIISLGGGFKNPTGLAVDGEGNVYVADTDLGAVQEIQAAGGYANVITLAGGSNAPNGVAVDAEGDVFVAFGANNVLFGAPSLNAVVEILAVEGSIPPSPTIVTLGGSFGHPSDVALDADGNVYVSDSQSGIVSKILAAGGYATDSPMAGGFGNPQGVAVAGNGTVLVSDTANNAVKEIFVAPPTPLFAATLPDSRSVQVGAPATIFASVINSGTADLDNCGIALAPSAPAGLTLAYQTTDPATNSLTGTPNTPVTIAGNDGSKTFLVAFTGTEPFNAPSMPLNFACDNAAPASIVAGVDTVDLSMSSTPVADIIALAATVSNNGILDVPKGGIAAFAVATSNLGADATIIATVDTGTSNLPISATICQSDPSSGACLGTSSSAVALDIADGATPTFSIFVQSSGAIAFAPASARVFVRFKDAAGNLHGSTSVAVETVN